MLKQIYVYGMLFHLPEALALLVSLFLIFTLLQARLYSPGTPLQLGDVSSLHAVALSQFGPVYLFRFTQLPASVSRAVSSKGMLLHLPCILLVGALVHIRVIASLRVS